MLRPYQRESKNKFTTLSKSRLVWSPPFCPKKHVVCLFDKFRNSSRGHPPRSKFRNMARSSHQLLAGALLVLLAVALASSDAEAAKATGSDHDRRQAPAAPPPPCPGRQEKGLRRPAPGPPSPQPRVPVYSQARFPPPPAAA